MGRVEPPGPDWNRCCRLLMRYAAYGSNLHPLRLQARVPSARLLGTGRLPGWALRFHKRGTDGSGKGSIVEAGGSVYVAVYEMSDDGMSVLDRIEGIDTGYRRASVGMPGFGACDTYLARPSHIDDALQPYDWYREMVLVGARVHGFPDGYVERICEIVTCTDPDAARRQANWALAERLRTSSLPILASAGAQP